LADLISEHLEIDDDFEAVQELYLERGWTDGLPVVPPTPERVAAMLAATPLSPQDIIGEIPPIWGSATVEKLAVNAVMAGCRPEYLPVVSLQWRPCATRCSTSTPSRPLLIPAPR